MVMIIGIDPGKGGGIAAKWSNGHETKVEVVRMPKTERDLWDCLRGFAESWVSVHAYIEKVHSSPQMGVKSAFTFGHGFGALLMALASLNISHDLVTPQTWQRKMQCLSKGDKNVTKARAQQLFPDMKVTHYIADALLIAEYGWRVHTW